MSEETNDLREKAIARVKIDWATTDAENVDAVLAVAVDAVKALPNPHWNAPQHLSSAAALVARHKFAAFEDCRRAVLALLGADQPGEQTDG